MTDKIEPALTPERVAVLLQAARRVVVVPGLGIVLYGQPFGLTREDVRAARAGADEVLNGCCGLAADACDECGQKAARLHSLADRIEAMVPPE